VAESPWPTSRQRAGGRAIAGHVAVIVALGLFGGAMFARVWLGGSPTGTVLCQCGDPGQSVWFMAWVPYALGHLRNPLFTDRMLAGQGGANLLESTSYLLPSFLLSPVTVLFGPTASFNVAETIAPVVSGWAMYVSAGALVDRFLPRFVASLLYGCSPWLVSAAIYGHLSLDWLYYPPLCFFLLYDIVARHRYRPFAAGLALGLLTVAEFFTGTEPLLITVLVAGAGLVLAALISPQKVRSIWRRTLASLGVAAGVAGVLLAYPLYFVLAGPRRVVGPPWPGINVYGNTFASFLHAGSGQAASIFSQVGGYEGVSEPVQSYLGIGLLVVLAVCLPFMILRRRTVALPLALAGLLAFVLSLGSLMMPLGPSSSPWWLLWKYLDGLPLLENVSPGRFSLVLAAIAALLLATGLDSAADVIDSWCSARISETTAMTAPRHLRRPQAAPSTPSLIASRVVGLGLSAAAMLPIFASYPAPLAMSNGAIPPWFATAALKLHAGTTVLTYPYASSTYPNAMYWQAVDRLGFALVGGRALVPGADGRHSEHVSPPTGSDGLLINASSGQGTPPPPTIAQVSALRSSLRHWQVEVIVDVDQGRSPSWAAVLFTEVTGALPRFNHEAAVWHLRSGHALGTQRRYTPAVVARCDSGGNSEQELRSTIRCLASSSWAGAPGS
jgi:hypothetical protein